ncbi:hypothetical protein SUGI_0613720 [Cryptomeria japonica]|nr:hypothetical protein SUGI_0613720 [Cryptomeria japonica]
MLNSSRIWRLFAGSLGQGQIERRYAGGLKKLGAHPRSPNSSQKATSLLFFATEEERLKILEGGLWTMDFKPLYIHRWHRNFNPLKIDPYEKLVWIRLNNLPMEYWTKEALEKIDRSLGTLMDIDADIAQGDSYIYTILQLVTVRRIPAYIKLRVHGLDWIQSIEIKEEKIYCSNCSRRNHSTIDCKEENQDLPQNSVEREEHGDLRAEMNIEQPYNEIRDSHEECSEDEEE